jgi:hypothetical protein
VENEELGSEKQEQGQILRFLTLTSKNRVLETSMRLRGGYAQDDSFCGEWKEVLSHPCAMKPRMSGAPEMLAG